MEREAPAKRAIARSVIDDVKDWWNTPASEATRVPKPETAYSKQDFDQSLDLVQKPLTLTLIELRNGKLTPGKCADGAAKLAPAIAALQTMAASKKTQANKANILTPIADIQSAQTTLKVLGDLENADRVWKVAFSEAMMAVDQAIPADESLASVKPAISALIELTNGPLGSFDPPTAQNQGQAILASLASAPPARAAIQKGLQAIQVYYQQVETSIAQAIASLEAAQVKVAQSAESYVDSVAKEHGL
jgi:hypothetical protein